MQLFCLSFPGAHCVRGVSSEWQTATSTCAVGSAVNQDELIDQQRVISTEKVGWERKTHTKSTKSIEMS